jgi:TIR domain-containing protein
MSGFVPSFENDLFISYAHDDDMAWVQAFEKSLGEELSRRLGLGVSVWHDGNRLRVGQNWQTEIETGVQRSAAFVAILSPFYENSDWCARERRLFIKLFTPENPFENSSRFFKVLKMPWDNNGHRHFLAAIQTLDFFRREEGSAVDVAFLPGSDDFRKAIGSLAHAAAMTLRKLRRERERVFVASPADDCREVWNQLREELRDQGYDVQPAGRRDDAFADELIQGEMERALLSVHLLGAAHDPFVERQILLAADQGQRLMFWLAPGAEATADEKQARLIKVLDNGQRPDRPEAALPPGWTLLQDLAPRAFIQEVLSALRPKPAAPEPASANGMSRIYIVHDATTEDDSRIASDLGKQIVQQEGMDVFLSRADLPSPAALRQRHEMLMQTCEGVLLCRSTAPKEWLMQVAPEVSFAEKLFQRAPLKSRAFLLTDPALLAGLPNFQPIPYSPQFRLGDLEPFLAPLRARGGAARGV